MRYLLLAMSLVFATVLHAATNTEVTEWSKKTLLQALTIDSQTAKEHGEENNESFTRNAWATLNTFLNEYIDTIHEKHLSTHPDFILEPAVVDSGIVSGIDYWRVNEEVLIPELQLKVAFSLLIIAIEPSAKGSFLIQSLDMVKQVNP